MVCQRAAAWPPARGHPERRHTEQEHAPPHPRCIDLTNTLQALMPPPKISVLIPTYNYARYLPEAIESVLVQDFSEFELLISDDCSTDDSVEVIGRYAAKDRRIRFQIQPARLGMVENWNWCLSEARGEYIKFVFGDDKLASRETLTKLLGLMRDNPSAALAASARYLIGAKSEVLETRDEFSKPGRHNGTEVICQCLDEDCNLVGEPSATLFRKRDAARGFNPRYRQLVDLEFWFHLLAQGDFVYTAEPLCCFRKHARQQTAVNDASGTGKWEIFQLFGDYRAKAYDKAQGVRWRQFNRLYELRKRRRRNAYVPEEMLEMERDLSRRISKPWYAVHWARRRISRPFDNLLRWLERRRRRGRRAAPASLQRSHW
jgi:glycosyltransferase involved in cell wall biosynthesis